MCPYPALADYVEYLQELAAEYKQEELPLPEAYRVLEAFGAMGPQVVDKRLSPQTPVLSGSLRLLPASTLFREDTTRYRARLGGSVQFVDSRISIAVADALGIPALSRCIKETLVSTAPFSTRAAQQLEPLLARIRSRIFISALQRLALKYLYRQIDVSVITRLHGLGIHYCSEIRTQLVLHGAGGPVDAGIGITESFYDADKNLLLLSLTSPDELAGSLRQGDTRDRRSDPENRNIIADVASHPATVPIRQSFGGTSDVPPLPAPDIIAPEGEGLCRSRSRSR